MNLIKFDHGTWPYLAKQRTRLLTEYALTIESSDIEISNALNDVISKDMATIAAYLPINVNNVNNVLDIGCGIGLIDLGLFRYYKDRNILFNLIDKDDFPTEDKVYRGFREDYCAYNNLYYTESFLKTNGLLNTNTISATDTDSINKLPKQDLIISLLSCGWHYPISTYIKVIKEKCHNETVVILDVRNNTNGEEILKNTFSRIVIVNNKSEEKIGKRYVCKI